MTTLIAVTKSSPPIHFSINGANESKDPNVPRQETKKSSPPPRPRKEVAYYDYHDPTGRVRFQVVRYEPKDFVQRRMIDGEWVI
jgi:hypothetical protein